MRYYLIAGEPSGDLHGANLMRGILKADADAVFRFWGGDMMAAAGGAQNLAKHYRDTSFFGIAEVVRNLPTILGQFGECRRDIERFAPDVLILIDYPGFNLRMARFAHERGIPVFYYIAPKVWAWKEWRVRQLRRYVDRLYTIFPFEGEYFRSKGIEPHFAGNPLADAIAARRPSFPSPGQFRRDHGLDSRPIVALLAGSRRSEIRANLKFMAHIARRMPDRQFVVAGVSWIERAEYDRMTRDMPVATVCDATYELLNISEAAVVTSGTATLETALLGIPELVVYGVPWIYEKLKPYVLKIPYVSLVNINLGRFAVRELIAGDFTEENVRREMRALLHDEDYTVRMRRDYAELRCLLGGDCGIPGAASLGSVALRLLHGVADGARCIGCFGCGLLGGCLGALCGFLCVLRALVGIRG